MATWEEITNAIAGILRIGHATLTGSLLKEELVVLASRPSPQYPDQVIFVYREAVTEALYGRVTQDAYQHTHGEIDGAGDWIIEARTLHTGAEETSASQLAKLAWAVLDLMAQHARATEWEGLLYTGGSVQEVEGQPGTWYLAEVMRFKVRWQMIF